MTERITGPLRAWYDLHEALAHEVTQLADAAAALEPSGADAFAERFAFFDNELRVHSEVEDGIMFPAIRARGGTVPDRLGADHHAEQTAVYDLGCALLEVRTTGRPDRIAEVADSLARLRDGLVRHLADEEDHVLPQVPERFDDAEQGELLRTIIGSMPVDSRLQSWVAASLTAEHREARLRNMAATLPAPVLASILTQIHDGVPAEVWTDIERRTPELAALVER